MLEVREIETKREMGNFVKFPFILYKNHPYWVPPILSDEKNTLDKSKNAAFDSAKARFWMAYEDGKPVGRVAAIFLEKYEEKWGQKRLRFGWLDFIDSKEVVFALLDTVWAWAKELDVCAVHGPMGFNDMDREGMLIEGFDRQGSMLTIYNEPYYNKYLEMYGFEKDVDWVEYSFETPEKNPELFTKMAKRVQEKTAYRLKTFANTKELVRWGHRIFEIYNKAYDHLYGAMPLNEKQIKAAINQYLKIIDPEFVLGIVDGNNRLVGFGVAMINMDDAVKKAKGRFLPFGFIPMLRAMRAKNTYITMLLIGLEPEVQKSGAVALMLNRIVDTCHKRKINRIYCLPELEDNKEVQKLWKLFATEIVRKRWVYIRYLKENAKMAYDYRTAQKKSQER